MNIQMEEMPKTSYVGKALSSHILSGHTVLPALPPVRQPKSYLNPIQLGFMEASSSRHDQMFILLPAPPLS